MSTTPPLPPGFGSDDLSRILLDILKRKSEDCLSGEASLVLRRAHHIVQCQGCTNALCTGKYSTSGQQAKSNNNNESRPSTSDSVSVSNIRDTCVESKPSRDVSDNNKNAKTNRGKVSKETEVTNGETSNQSKVTNGESSNQSKVTNKESSNLKRQLDANKNSKSAHVQKKKRSDNSDEKTKHTDYSVLIGPNFWRQPKEILLRTPSRESESSTESSKSFWFHGRYVTVKDDPFDIPFAYDSRPSPIIDPRRVNHSSPPRQVIEYDKDTDS